MNYLRGYQGYTIDFLIQPLILKCYYFSKHSVFLVNQSDMDETYTIGSYLNETFDEGSEDSMSEVSEQNLPFLLS